MPYASKKTVPKRHFLSAATPAFVLTIGVLLGLPPGSADAALPPEDVQRIIIVGTRIRPTNGFYWGPFQAAVRSTISLGPWQNEDEMLDARSECVAMGWKWPKTKDSVSAALHDVRCNPATAVSQARALTSVSDENGTGDVLRWHAAGAIYSNVRLVESYKPGSQFQVMWADGGTTRYVVTNALGNMALELGTAVTSAGSGVAEPSPNCVKG